MISYSGLYASMTWSGAQLLFRNVPQHIWYYDIFNQYKTAVCFVRL